MTNEEELKRRIELKRQLVLLTVEEIWALEDELNKACSQKEKSQDDICVYI
jgi:hypothetical protein